jgi:hypothetical protein
MVKTEDQLLQEYILKKFKLHKKNNQISVNLQGVSLYLVGGIISAAKSKQITTVVTKNLKNFPT